MVRRKVNASHELMMEERLALFDATTRWLDELQAKELKAAKAKGTRDPEIISEDFEHGRLYGAVRIRNPFVALGLA